MLLVALLTAAALIAQQVAANAMRDALFLTWFPVTSLPFFVGSSAILAVPAVEAAGRLLVRFGSARVVPTALALSGVLFITEWVLLDEQPRAVAVTLTCTRPCSQRLRYRCSGHSSTNASILTRRSR